MKEFSSVINAGIEQEEPPHVAAGWAWFRRHGSPIHWVAPLVGLSEPAFRILCRRHGAEMAHTQMVDPGGFARSPTYRNQILGPKSATHVDAPLVLQLGGSNIDMLLEAALVAVQDGRCCAIELNCGCPQRCAKKGRYGAFLLDSHRQHILLELIAVLRKALPPEMPLLVKMRVLFDKDETAVLAQKIVAAGAGLLTVHGRTRRQGGGARTTGQKGERLASWPHIRAVKEAVSVPVIANGNVPDFQAAKDILLFTGCDGVMSGCGLLRDPKMFSKTAIDMPPCSDDESRQSQLVEDWEWECAVHTAREYLALAIKYCAHDIQVSKHLLWMLDDRGFKRRAPELRERTVQLKFAPDKDANVLTILGDLLLETLPESDAEVTADR